MTYDDISLPQWVAALALVVWVAWNVGKEVNDWWGKRPPKPPPVALYRKGSVFVAKTWDGAFGVFVERDGKAVEVDSSSVLDVSIRSADHLAKQLG